jgi:Protein of unknown function (DUF402)
MELSLEIRGIYTTALTRFFLERGIAVASLSETTAGSNREPQGFSSHARASVHVTDLPDPQGVLIQGSRKEFGLVIRHLQDAFVDIICRPVPGRDGMAVEFPYLTKAALDEIRNTVVPSVANHHRLRLISSESVDLVEKRELADHPDKREAVSRDLENTLVWNTYRNGVILKLEHVKLDGRILLLSEGEIVAVDRQQKQVTLRRGAFKGRTTYDGLDIAKEPGDYAISAVREGEWFYKHTYFRRHGALIGTYYNINTWVECYPDRIRYVDLEVDVVAWPDGRAEITDEDELRERCERGYITPELRDRAMETAYRILSVAQASRDTSPDG